MKIQGATGPNEVRKAAPKSIALTMASPVRVVIVDGSKLIQKGGCRRSSLAAYMLAHAGTGAPQLAPAPASRVLC